VTVPELSSTFNATPDGVMTNEVGVISGDLELRTTLGEDGTLRLNLRYAGAAEWYTLKGTGYPPPGGCQPSNRRPDPTDVPAIRVRLRIPGPSGAARRSHSHRQVASGRLTGCSGRPRHMRRRTRTGMDGWCGVPSP
jgi:hypothetical protein